MPHVAFGLDHPNSLGRVHLSQLSELCEQHDKLGSFSGWFFQHRGGVPVVGLVFEHGLAVYDASWRLQEVVPVFQGELS